MPCLPQFSKAWKIDKQTCKHDKIKVFSYFFLISSVGLDYHQDVVVVGKKKNVINMKKKGVVVCKLEKKGLYSEVYIYKMLDDEEEEEEKGETVLRAFFFFSNCF